MVRVGELLRDVGGVGVVEVPADIDGEHEREEVGVAVPDGRVQGGVAVLVLHGHLGWIGGKLTLSCYNEAWTLMVVL